MVLSQALELRQRFGLRAMGGKEHHETRAGGRRGGLRRWRLCRCGLCGGSAACCVDRLRSRLRRDRAGSPTPGSMEATCCGEAGRLKLGSLRSYPLCRRSCCPAGYLDLRTVVSLGTVGGKRGEVEPTVWVVPPGWGTIWIGPVPLRRARTPPVAPGQHCSTSRNDQVRSGWLSETISSLPSTAAAFAAADFIGGKRGRGR